MRTKQRSNQRRVQCASMLITLTVILLFSCPQKTLAQWSTSGNDIYNSNSGNVGVGTTSPGVKLDILSSVNLIARFGTTAGAHTQVLIDAPSAYNSNLTLQRGGVSKWYMGNRASNDRLSFIESAGLVETLTLLQNGNVGIGTISPGAALDVVNSVSAGTGTARFKNTNANTQVIIDSAAGQNVSLRLDNTGLPVWYFGNAAVDDRVRFLNSNANGNVEVLTILQSGDVGIGTTSPTDKLYVNGNTRITQNLTVDGTVQGGYINTKYQDLAEWVESSQGLSAGTVVVVDHTKSNQVIASSQAYDTRVAGVISERPGIALGEAGDKKVLVATTGRVKLTVDASKGPIQIGDLLVTSDVPGVAMKSQPVNVGGVQLHRPGTLVGKALEPLAKGQGKILVLLSLQ